MEKKLTDIIYKDGRFWVYDEEEVLKFAEENAHKYSSINDMFKKHGMESINPLNILRGKYMERIDTFNWDYKENCTKIKKIYHDEEWMRQKYFKEGLTVDEIADEAGAGKRVIRKWLNEVFGFTNNQRRANVRLTQKQNSIVIGSMLGDGHIDKREKYPIFIVSHAENQKNYLYWKYDIFKNLCNSEPKKADESKAEFNGKMYDIQRQYRFITRSYSCFDKFRKMRNMDYLNEFDELAFSVWMLDDGHRAPSSWGVYFDQFTREEKAEVHNILEEKFGVRGHMNKDERYMYFYKDETLKIDEIILRNIPNDLDIIKYKILKE